jgi:hypothetical protein
VSSTRRSWPTSFATAAKTCAGDDSRATRVATRRSAACSSASRPTSARASVLEIAVATSSVKAVILDSVSGASGSSPLDETIITPQRRPSTTIGAPTDDSRPSSRIVVAIGPAASS